MKTSSKIGISIVAIVAVLSSAFKLYEVKQQKKTEIDLVSKAKSEIPITTTIAKMDVVKVDIDYNGTFEPSCEVTVVSESQGKITKYAINEGDFISEGKTFAWLDNDLLSYQLEIAEAAYQKAQRDLTRFENLSQGEAVSTQQMEEITLAFKNARSIFLTTKKQYDNSFVKAPISGTVGKRYFEKGTFIAPGSPLADIIDTRKMKFNAWFTAQDLARVCIGQKVVLTTDLHPGVSYEGIIKVIGVKPDNSRRYLVETEVMNNTKKTLISGIDGTIHIKSTSDKKSLVIPRNCIVSSSIQPKVYVVTDNQVKLRSVIISEIINNQAVIESGLTEGECVVLSGQINLEDNAMVKVLSNLNF
jgi:membrane fusion protein, multidrug efflux system